MNALKVHASTGGSVFVCIVQLVLHNQDFMEFGHLKPRPKQEHYLIKKRLQRAEKMSWWWKRR